MVPEPSGWQGSSINWRVKGSGTDRTGQPLWAALLCGFWAAQHLLAVLLLFEGTRLLSAPS